MRQLISLFKNSPKYHLDHTQYRSDFKNYQKRIAEMLFHKHHRQGLLDIHQVLNNNHQFLHQFHHMSMYHLFNMRYHFDLLLDQLHILHTDHHNFHQWD